MRGPSSATSMLIGAGASWGATTLVIKATQAQSHFAPEKTLVYQLAVSVPILAVAGVLPASASP